MRIITERLQTPTPSLHEVLRYMKAGRTPDEPTLGLAEEGIKRIVDAAVCKVCYARVMLEPLGDGDILLGDLVMHSEKLCAWTDGCNEAFVFAATVGQGVDRVIRATSATSAALSLACDAAGSALVEEVCDMLSERLDREIISEGSSTVKRYSAGYGDLDIGYQKDISRMLDTSKNIGASLTGGIMMSPTKTVTAIIGIKSRG